MADTDASTLLDLAVTAARAGAELAVRRRAEGLGVIDTKSTDTDLVTAADRAVERLLIEILLGARPGDRVLGEEGGEAGVGEADGSDGSVRWVIDPIDGTVNYVYGLPQYAVSIAAEAGGRVVAGVVRNAATGEEWTAIRGGGAWRDGRRLAGSAATTLDRCLVATGFGYDAARRAHQAAVLANLLPQIRDVRRFGAASIDLCLAAEGRVDAYYEKGLNAWDHAAGGLIATEAGLLVTGLRGEPPGPTMVVAAMPAVHDEFHTMLVDLDADGGP